RRQWPRPRASASCRTAPPITTCPAGPDRRLGRSCLNMAVRRYDGMAVRRPTAPKLPDLVHNVAPDGDDRRAGGPPARIYSQARHLRAFAATLSHGDQV